MNNLNSICFKYLMMFKLKSVKQVSVEPFHIDVIMKQMSTTIYGTYLYRRVIGEGRCRHQAVWGNLKQIVIQVKSLKLIKCCILTRSELGRC